MAYAYDASLINRIFPRINQYEATTGRRITPAMLESLLRAEMSGEVEKAKSSALIEKQDIARQEELALRREQIGKESQEATIGGAVNLATTGGMLALGYKALTRPTDVDKLLAFSKGGQTAFSSVPTTATGGAQPALFPTAFASAPELSAGTGM